MTDPQQRAISNCEHKLAGSNCKKCGVYCHKGNLAVKTNTFESFLNCSAQKYLKHMRTRQS